MSAKGLSHYNVRQYKSHQSNQWSIPTWGLFQLSNQEVGLTWGKSSGDVEFGRAQVQPGCRLRFPHWALRDGLELAYQAFFRQSFFIGKLLRFSWTHLLITFLPHMYQIATVIFLQKNAIQTQPNISFVEVELGCTLVTSFQKYLSIYSRAFSHLKWLQQLLTWLHYISPSIFLP